MMADYGLGISVTPLEALRGYPHLTRRVIAGKGPCFHRLNLYFARMPIFQPVQKPYLLFLRA